MSGQHMIDKRPRLIVMKTHQAQLLSDPDCDPEFKELLDLSAVTGMDISADENVSSPIAGFSSVLGVPSWHLVRRISG